MFPPKVRELIDRLFAPRVPVVKRAPPAWKESAPFTGRNGSKGAAREAEKFVAPFYVTDENRQRRRREA
jgi:hypothetical protein